MPALPGGFRISKGLMLTLEDALARILAVMPVPRPEQIPLTEAHGRIVAEQIVSPVDLPAFDNSAMDGYAVRAADLALAKAETPVSLRLAGKVAAGEVFNVACCRAFRRLLAAVLRLFFLIFFPSQKNTVGRIGNPPYGTSGRDARR